MRGSSRLISARRAAVRCGSPSRPAWLAARTEQRVMWLEVPTAAPHRSAGPSDRYPAPLPAPRESLAVALGPLRQQCRLPVSPAVRLPRRSDRHRIAPAIRSATNGAPSLVAPGDCGALRRPDRTPACVQGAAGRSVHERRCRSCLRAGPQDLLL